MNIQIEFKIYPNKYKSYERVLEYFIYELDGVLDTTEGITIRETEED